MDVLTVTKVVGGLVGILGIWRFFYEFRIHKKSQLRDEYKFSKDFLETVDKNELHPFSLEKGYQAIAGSKAIKAYEIEYILSLEDPAQCLRDYVHSKSLMNKLETEGNLRLTFKNKYKKVWSRTLRKWLYILLYMIFAIIAISPLLFSRYLTKEHASIFEQLLITFPFGGFYAWIAVNAYLKIQRGEALINNQKCHKQRVIINPDNFKPPHG